MCLITSQSEPLIAEKDIVVYKALTKSLRSPCWGFKYKLKILYETSLGVAFNYSGETVINKGFHACSTKECALLWGKYVYKCIIPRGSKYYLSDKGNEIVSDKLIVKRKLLFNLY